MTPTCFWCCSTSARDAERALGETPASPACDSGGASVSLAHSSTSIPHLLRSIIAYRALRLRQLVDLRIFDSAPSQISANRFFEVIVGTDKHQLASPFG
jgi:hypothetical protein